jgi:hypothetical protein
MPSPPRYSLAAHERNTSNTEYSNAEEVNTDAILEQVLVEGRGDNHPFLGYWLPMKRPRTPTKKSKYPPLPASPPATPRKTQYTKRRTGLKHKKSGGGRTRRLRR